MIEDLKNQLLLFLETFELIKIFIWFLQTGIRWRKKNKRPIYQIARPFSGTTNSLSILC